MNCGAGELAPERRVDHDGGDLRNRSLLTGTDFG